MVTALIVGALSSVVRAQTIKATGPYNGPPGFSRDQATTRHCGNNPESWVRASGELNKETGRLSFNVQLETDSTTAGPQGRAIFTFKGEGGAALAEITTHEIAMGGKRPGKAVIKDFGNQFSIPPSIAKQTRSIEARVECTGKRVSLWGLLDNRVPIVDVQAFADHVSSRSVTLTSEDAKKLTSTSFAKTNVAQLDAYQKFIKVSENNAKSSTASKVQLYQIQGEEFSALPAIGALMLGDRPSCTATMITKWRALTAAHCVKDVDPKDLSFVVGLNAAASTDKYPVASIKVHKDYSEDNYDSPDLAIVELGKEFNGDPIAIARKDMSAELASTFITMIGYGYSGQTAGGVWYGLGIKRRIDVKIGTLHPAAMRYEPFKGKTACRGDSGGPALYIDPYNGGVSLVGVTSYGTGLCNSFVQDVRIDFSWPHSGSAQDFARFIIDEINKG